MNLSQETLEWCKQVVADATPGELIMYAFDDTDFDRPVADEIQRLALERLAV
jgi:hypothetical protein